MESTGLQVYIPIDHDGPKIRYIADGSRLGVLHNGHKFNQTIGGDHYIKLDTEAFRDPLHESVVPHDHRRNPKSGLQTSQIVKISSSCSGLRWQRGESPQMPIFTSHCSQQPAELPWYMLVTWSGSARSHSLLLSLRPRESSRKPSLLRPIQFVFGKTSLLRLLRIGIRSIEVIL